MMDIVFLGADAWRPEGLESDTVSLLINGSLMIDTGWHPVHNLIREGKSPDDIQTLLLTHLHQDHRIGLTQMMFWLLNSHLDASGIEIKGVEGVDRIVDMALEYAGKSEYYSSVPGPQVGIIGPGERFERCGVTIETAQSHHAVNGVMYAFSDGERRVVYSGDTAPHADTEALATGADILIHECSYGARGPEGENHWGHSGADEAARIALKCGVKRLILVHCDPKYNEDALKAAREIFPDTERAYTGMRI